MGEKWIGEAEFNNITMKLNGGRPTDAASVANGIEWQGQVQILFIERSRSIWEHTTGPEIQKDVFDRWMSLTNASTSLPEFSQWTNGGWGFNLIKQNGKINGSIYNSWSGWLSGFEIPSEGKTFLGGCPLDRNSISISGCKSVLVEPK